MATQASAITFMSTPGQAYDDGMRFVQFYFGLPLANRVKAKDVAISKLFTALWGLFAIGFAMFASLVDNLIEAVNILGSLFYGTILGLFVVAFFLKHVKATPVFIGALVAEATVVALFFTTDLGFLWFNAIGCGVVVIISLILQGVLPRPNAATPNEA